MKIVSISMVRNEADIIELFVKYCLRFVDQMIVIDHLSTDSTLEILRALQAQGSPIEIVRESRPGYFQAEYMTRQMKRAVEEYGADWVLPLDADEFLVAGNAADGRAIRPRLEDLRPDQLFAVAWRTYVPQADDSLRKPYLFDRIGYRRAKEHFVQAKVIVPREIASKESTVLKMGSHGVRDLSRRKRKTLAYEEIPDMHLAHFPLRSCEQLTGKVLLTWSSILLAKGPKSKVGWHLCEMAEKLLRGEEITPTDVSRFAMEYGLPESERDLPQELIFDPVQPCGRAISLQFPARYELDSAKDLLRTIEDFVQEEGLDRKLGIWDRFLSRVGSRRSDLT